ncbi:MAG TPA: hypothetical protein VI819_02795 [Patescibacteria group bacterium]|nr:hypothetical protein [Patescibacteria group bacterium]
MPERGGFVESAGMAGIASGLALLVAGLTGVGLAVFFTGVGLELLPKR